MNATTAKQTAGNNFFLARVKALYNASTFAAVMAIVNTDGIAAGRQYVCDMQRTTDAKLDGFMASTIDNGYAGKRDRLPKLCR